MTGGLLARAALLAVALTAALWLAHGLRALDLRAEGLRKVEGAGRPLDEATAQDARALFRAAALRNPDPTPRLDEAALLMATDRDREAVRLLDEVTRDNPGNIRAWGLLATASAAFDDRRTTKAYSELLQLYGEVEDEPQAPRTIRAVDGRRFIVIRGRVEGVVDRSRVIGSIATFRGWSASIDARRPADAVIAVAHGRVVATAAVRLPRLDLVERHGAALARSGFELSVPLARLQDRRGDVDVQFFGAGRGVASPITVNCANAGGPLGC